MAVPTVEANNADTPNNTGTSITVNYPASVTSGELVLIWGVVSRCSSSATLTVNQSGASNLTGSLSANGSSEMACGRLFAFKASGGESSCTLSSTQSGHLGAISVRVSNWDGTVANIPTVTTSELDNQGDNNASTPANNNGSDDEGRVLRFSGWAEDEGSSPSMTSHTMLQDPTPDIRNSSGQTRGAINGAYGTTDGSGNAAAATGSGWWGSNPSGEISCTIVVPSAPSNINETLVQGNLTLDGKTLTVTVPAWLEAIAYRWRNPDGGPEAP